MPTTTIKLTKKQQEQMRILYPNLPDPIIRFTVSVEPNVEINLESKGRPIPGIAVKKVKRKARPVKEDDFWDIQKHVNALINKKSKNTGKSLKNYG